MSRSKALLVRSSLLLAALALMGGALGGVPANASDVLPPDGTTSGPSGPCGGAGTIKFRSYTPAFPVYYYGEIQNCYSSSQRLRVRFNVPVPGANSWGKCTTVAPGSKLTQSSPSYEAVGWGYC